MRILSILLVFLVTLQLAFGDRCACYCCATAENCKPSRIDTYFVWNCDNSTCKAETCVDDNYKECPRPDAPGKTEARCDGTRQLISPLLILLGMISTILMIKNTA